MNEGEKKVAGEMIGIYCRSKHNPLSGLCEECAALYAYAIQRLERCHYGEAKPTCGLCPIHCYRKDMRLRIKEVMRFSGPRMLLLYP